MSRYAWQAALATTLLLVAAPALSFPWSKDMVDQPAVKPQESLVTRPADVVPTAQGERLPVPKNATEVVETRVLVASRMTNPVPVSNESIAAGKAAYEVHCLVCHGATGKGDGSVGLKYVPPPMDLTNDYVQLQAEGQIFYTITHGSIIMPFYRDALSVNERWNVINYIRNGLVQQ